MVRHTSIEHTPSPTPLPNLIDIPSLICWKCGEVIPGDSKYCPFCSTLLFVVCPCCGHKYSAQYPCCNQCGTNRESYQTAKEIQEWLRGKKEIDLRMGEVELQRKRQEEALRQSEKEKRARLQETETFDKSNGSVCNLACAYIKRMGLYLEQETFFINLVYEVKRDYMERFLFDHHIIDAHVENIVGAVIRDKAYWERRDCLDGKSLEEECIRAYTYLYKNNDAIY